MAGKLLTEKQVEEQFGLPITSLQQWRYKTKKLQKQMGPLFSRVIGRIYYRTEDVARFIDLETRKSAETATA